MKHLVILGSVWPEPRSSAAGTRMAQLIDLFIQSGWRVTFASAAAPSSHRLDLEALGVEEAVVALNSDRFDDWLRRRAPEAVLFDRFMTEEQFGWRVGRTCPDALRILDTEDLHSLRAARAALLKERQGECSGELARQSVGPVRTDADTLYRAMAGTDLAQRELAAIYRSDLSLIISGFEQRLLTRQFRVPEALLLNLPLFARPGDDTPGFEARRHFVSIGNFRHAPNWDAVLWLKHALWPRIRAALPEAELHLYGAYPPPRATALARPDQGFRVPGWVDDAPAVMREARVCLAPLRFGAGQKGKLLEAMQCGTPSVTTDIGAEGMMSGAPWPGALANDTEALVQAAVALYREPERWWRAHRRCRAALAPFDRAGHRQRFEQTLEELRGQLPQHRRQNFVGAMLNHHHHRSTQYMSQWIETKQRLQALGSPPTA